jgi:uncharacterized protein
VTQQSTATTPGKPPDGARQGMNVFVASHKLSASIRLSPQADGEAAVTFEDIKTELKKKGITYGINEDAIQRLVANPTFTEEVEIAHGKEPVSGKDARLNIKIKTVPDLSPKEDADGRIDYKDINFIQSAAKGQVLVEKIVATAGTPGTDVYGSPVSAKTGSDVKLPVGTNTTISEDGMNLIAAADGSIIYANRRISVNELHIIGGDVCIVTGNIKHNGSLIIHGKVEPGFEVLALGNIEIGKDVTDAKIISGGNIMVKGGFLGNRRGLLKSEGDIHCKYVDDQIVAAGHDIYVGGELFNSMITARNKVMVFGSKGRIVGGKVMAGNEIRATCLGSESGTKTELQVGFDAQLMKKYQQVNHDLKAIQENTERVKEGLYTLYRMQLNRKLSPDQTNTLAQLEELKKSLPGQEKELLALKASLEIEIQRNQTAKIIAEKKVYPGVILQFGVVYREINDVMGPSYFQISGSTITWEEYRAGKSDILPS